MASFPLVKFLGEVRSETAKVTWPSRNQTIKLTIIVLVTSSLVSMYVFGLDFIFQQLVRLLLRAK